MNSRQIRLTSIRWIYLMAIQLFVLNNVLLGGYLNPYLYVLIIILLPFRMNVATSLVLAFSTGLILDLMMNTAGIHAAALTATCYLRFHFVKRLQKRNDEVQEASISELGFGNFIVFAISLCLFHHILLFFLDQFRWDEIFLLLLRSLASGLLTLLLIVIHELLSQSGRRHVL